MKFLNASLILLLLLINVVRITCPSSEENDEETEEVYPVGLNPDLARCMQKIYSEFGFDDNVHDLLYGFYNIKFHTYFWNAKTNINEMIYKGKQRLSKLTFGYYSDLFYTALEVGLTEIPTPRQFCNAYEESKQDECLRDIQAIGCAADLKGSKCAEHLYFFWQKPDEPGPFVGTEDISTENILEAIYRGREFFRSLSEEQLVKRLTRQVNIYSELSDRQLLENIGFDRNKYFENFDDEGSSNVDELLREEEFERQYKNYLHEARLRRYGIGTVSYPDLCIEYIRRCKESKASVYTRHIHDKLKVSCDMHLLPSRTFYCAKYLSEKMDD